MCKHMAHIVHDKKNGLDEQSGDSSKTSNNEVASVGAGSTGIGSNAGADWGAIEIVSSDYTEM